jgi:hypothetical protein
MTAECGDFKRAERRAHRQGLLREDQGLRDCPLTAVCTRSDCRYLPKKRKLESSMETPLNKFYARLLAHRRLAEGK